MPALRFVAMVIAGAAAIVGGVAWAQQGGSDGPERVVNLPYWAPEDLPVHYCVQAEQLGFTSIDELAEVTAEAFELWGAPTVYDGICKVPTEFGIDDDRVNEIAFRRLEGTGGLGITFQELACRDECDAAADHALKEADIVVEAYPDTERRNRDCLKSPVMHEIGHFLGMSHTASEGIMWAGGLSFDCPTELSERDRQMFENRYGSAGNGKTVRSWAGASVEELFVRKIQSISGAAYVGEADEARTAELYGLHSPAFQLACPLATYRLHLNEGIAKIEDGPFAVSFEVVKAGAAYVDVIYEFAWIPADADGEWKYESLRRSHPDRWVLIDNRWYDDIDDNTPC